MHRELIAAPDREVVGVAERLHLAHVFRARREGEEPRAAAVAERAVEGERPGLAPQLELQAGGGEAIVVHREPVDPVGRHALPVAPVAVVLVVGAQLQERGRAVQLGRPGAMDLGGGRGRALRPPENGGGQDERCDDRQASGEQTGHAVLLDRWDWTEEGSGRLKAEG